MTSAPTRTVLVARIAEENARTLAMQLRKIAEEAVPVDKSLLLQLARRVDGVVAGIQELTSERTSD